MIDFSFTLAQETLQVDIILLAQQQMNEGLVQRDKEQQFHQQGWAAAGQLGLQGLAISKAYGGQGLDIISCMHALEALGYGCRDNGLSFAIAAHLLSVVVPIGLYGTEVQKEELLPSLCNGEWIAANAMTEKSSGSDAFNMATTATASEEGYLLQGEKQYCSNAPLADLVLTYAITDAAKGAMGGISAFLLKSDQFTAGEKVDKMGLRSCLMSNLVFDNIPLSVSSLLGKAGGGMMIFSKSMLWERIGMSLLHLGTLQRLLEEAIVFIKERKAFGQPLSRQQAVAHTLANIQTELTAARWASYYAAWCLQQNKKADFFAAIAKLKATELYKQSTAKLLQLYGAAGYTNNSDIERMLRDATASTLYSGSSEIQRNKIAGWMKL